MNWSRALLALALALAACGGSEPVEDEGPTTTQVDRTSSETSAPIQSLVLGGDEAPAGSVLVEEASGRLDSVLFLPAEFIAVLTEHEVAEWRLALFTSSGSSDPSSLGPEDFVVASAVARSDNDDRATALMDELRSYATPLLTEIPPPEVQLVADDVFTARLSAQMNLIAWRNGSDIQVLLTLGAFEGESLEALVDRSGGN